jgi:starvation-inducible DNA-binding protein
MASKNGTKKATFPDIGLSADAFKGVVNVLRTVLADEHVLYIKLRKFHWNVTGPQFHSLHVTFEEQYTALALTIDEIAERIVQYGAEAPGTLTEFIDHARLSESPGEVPSAHDMVAAAVEDHQAMVRYLRDDIDKVGEEFEDVAAEDFLTGLLQVHQKQAWMLRALVEGEMV